MSLQIEPALSGFLLKSSYTLTHTAITTAGRNEEFEKYSAALWGGLSLTTAFGAAELGSPSCTPFPSSETAFVQSTRSKSEERFFQFLKAPHLPRLRVPSLDREVASTGSLTEMTAVGFLIYGKHVCNIVDLCRSITRLGQPSAIVFEENRHSQVRSSAVSSAVLFTKDESKHFSGVKCVSPDEARAVKSKVKHFCRELRGVLPCFPEGLSRLRSLSEASENTPLNMQGIAMSDKEIRRSRANVGRTLLFCPYSFSDTHTEPGSAEGFTMKDTLLGSQSLRSKRFISVAMRRLRRHLQLTLQFLMYSLQEEMVAEIALASRTCEAFLATGKALSGSGPADVTSTGAKHFTNAGSADTEFSREHAKDMEFLQLDLMNRLLTALTDALDWHQLTKTYHFVAQTGEQRHLWEYALLSSMRLEGAQRNFVTSLWTTASWAAIFPALKRSVRREVSQARGREDAHVVEESYAVESSGSESDMESGPKYSTHRDARSIQYARWGMRVKRAHIPSLESAVQCSQQGERAEEPAHNCSQEGVRLSSATRSRLRNVRGNLKLPDADIASVPIAIKSSFLMNSNSTYFVMRSSAPLHSMLELAGSSFQSSKVPRDSLGPSSSLTGETSISLVGVTRSQQEELQTFRYLAVNWCRTVDSAVAFTGAGSRRARGAPLRSEDAFTGIATAPLQLFWTTNQSAAAVLAFDTRFGHSVLSEQKNGEPSTKRYDDMSSERDVGGQRTLGERGGVTNTRFALVQHPGWYIVIEASGSLGEPISPRLSPSRAARHSSPSPYQHPSSPPRFETEADVSFSPSPSFSPPTYAASLSSCSPSRPPPSASQSPIFTDNERRMQVSNAGIRREVLEDHFGQARMYTVFDPPDPCSTMAAEEAGCLSAIKGFPAESTSLWALPVRPIGAVTDTCSSTRVGAEAEAGRAQPETETNCSKNATSPVLLVSPAIASLALRVNRNFPQMEGFETEACKRGLSLCYTPIDVGSCDVLRVKAAAGRRVPISPANELPLGLFKTGCGFESRLKTAGIFSHSENDVKNCADAVRLTLPDASVLSDFTVESSRGPAAENEPPGNYLTYSLLELVPFSPSSSKSSPPFKGLDGLSFFTYARHRTILQSIPQFSSLLGRDADDSFGSDAGAVEQWWGRRGPMRSAIKLIVDDMNPHFVPEGERGRENGHRPQGALERSQAPISVPRGIPFLVHLHDRIADPYRLLLLGPTSSGKTTVLSWWWESSVAISQSAAIGGQSFRFSVGAAQKTIFTRIAGGGGPWSFRDPRGGNDVASNGSGVPSPPPLYSGGSILVACQATDLPGTAGPHLIASHVPNADIIVLLFDYRDSHTLQRLEEDYLPIVCRKATQGTTFVLLGLSADSSRTSVTSFRLQQTIEKGQQMRREIVSERAKLVEDLLRRRERREERRRKQRQESSVGEGLIGMGGLTLNVSVRSQAVHLLGPQTSAISDGAVSETVGESSAKNSELSSKEDALKRRRSIFGAVRQFRKMPPTGQPVVDSRLAISGVGTNIEDPPAKLSTAFRGGGGKVSQSLLADLFGGASSSLNGTEGASGNRSSEKEAAPVSFQTLFGSTGWGKWEGGVNDGNNGEESFNDDDGPEDVETELLADAETFFGSDLARDEWVVWGLPTADELYVAKNKLRELRAAARDKRNKRKEKKQQADSRVASQDGPLGGELSMTRSMLAADDSRTTARVKETSFHLEGKREKGQRPRLGSRRVHGKSFVAVETPAFDALFNDIANLNGSFAGGRGSSVGEEEGGSSANEGSTESSADTDEDDFENDDEDDMVMATATGVFSREEDGSGNYESRDFSKEGLTSSMLSDISDGGANFSIAGIGAKYAGGPTSSSAGIPAMNASPSSTAPGAAQRAANNYLSALLERKHFQRFCSLYGMRREVYESLVSVSRKASCESSLTDAAAACSLATLLCGPHSRNNNNNNNDNKSDERLNSLPTTAAASVHDSANVATTSVVTKFSPRGQDLPYSFLFTFGDTRRWFSALLGLLGVPNRSIHKIITDSVLSDYIALCRVRTDASVAAAVESIAVGSSSAGRPKSQAELRETDSGGEEGEPNRDDEDKAAEEGIGYETSSDTETLRADGTASSPLSFESAKKRNKAADSLWFVVKSNLKASRHRRAKVARALIRSTTETIMKPLTQVTDFLADTAAGVPAADGGGVSSPLSTKASRNTTKPKNRFAKAARKEAMQYKARSYSVAEIGEARSDGLRKRSGSGSGGGARERSPLLPFSPLYRRYERNLKISVRNGLSERFWEFIHDVQSTLFKRKVFFQKATHTGLYRHVPLLSQSSDNSKVSRGGVGGGTRSRALSHSLSATYAAKVGSLQRRRRKERAVISSHLKCPALSAVLSRATPQEFASFLCASFDSAQPLSFFGDGSSLAGKQTAAPSGSVALPSSLSGPAKHSVSTSSLLLSMLFGTDDSSLPMEERYIVPVGPQWLFLRWLLTSHGTLGDAVGEVVMLSLTLRGYLGATDDDRLGSGGGEYVSSNSRETSAVSPYLSRPASSLSSQTASATELIYASLVASGSGSVLGSKLNDLPAMLRVGRGMDGSGGSGGMLNRYHVSFARCLSSTLTASYPPASPRSSPPFVKLTESDRGKDEKNAQLRLLEMWGDPRWLGIEYAATEQRKDTFSSSFLPPVALHEIESKSDNFLPLEGSSAEHGQGGGSKRLDRRSRTDPTDRSHLLRYFPLDTAIENKLLHCCSPSYSSTPAESQRDPSMLVPSFSPLRILSTLASGPDGQVEHESMLNKASIKPDASGHRNEAFLGSGSSENEIGVVFQRTLLFLILQSFTSGGDTQGNAPDELMSWLDMCERTGLTLFSSVNPRSFVDTLYTGRLAERHITNLAGIAGIVDGPRFGVILPHAAQIAQPQKVSVVGSPRGIHTPLTAPTQSVSASRNDVNIYNQSFVSVNNGKVPSFEVEDRLKSFLSPSLLPYPLSILFATDFLTLEKVIYGEARASDSARGTFPASSWVSATQRLLKFFSQQTSLAGGRHGYPSDAIVASRPSSPDGGGQSSFSKYQPREGASSVYTSLVDSITCYYRMIALSHGRDGDENSPSLSSPYTQSSPPPLFSPSFVDKEGLRLWTRYALSLLLKGEPLIDMLLAATPSQLSALSSSNLFPISSSPSSALRQYQCPPIIDSHHDSLLIPIRSSLHSLCMFGRLLLFSDEMLVPRTLTLAILPSTGAAPSFSAPTNNRKNRSDRDQPSKHSSVSADGKERDALSLTKSTACGRCGANFKVLSQRWRRRCYNCWQDFCGDCCVQRTIVKKLGVDHPYVKKRLSELPRAQSGELADATKPSSSSRNESLAIENKSIINTNRYKKLADGSPLSFELFKEFHRLDGLLFLKPKRDWWCSSCAEERYTRHCITGVSDVVVENALRGAEGISSAKRDSEKEKSLAGESARGETLGNADHTRRLPPRNSLRYRRSKELNTGGMAQRGANKNPKKVSFTFLPMQSVSRASEIDELLDSNEESEGSPTRTHKRIVPKTSRDDADVVATASVSAGGNASKGAVALWVPDSASLTCPLCRLDFTLLLRRRHHCRACGTLCCGDCSRGRQRVSGYGQPQRVCRACENSGRRVPPLALNSSNLVVSSPNRGKESGGEGKSPSRGNAIEESSPRAARKPIMAAKKGSSRDGEPSLPPIDHSSINHMLAVAVSSDSGGSESGYDSSNLYYHHHRYDKDDGDEVFNYDDEAFDSDDDALDAILFPIDLLAAHQKGNSSSSLLGAGNRDFLESLTSEEKSRLRRERWRAERHRRAKERRHVQTNAKKGTGTNAIAKDDTDREMKRSSSKASLKSILKRPSVSLGGVNTATSVTLSSPQTMQPVVLRPNDNTLVCEVKDREPEVHEVPKNVNKKPKTSALLELPSRHSGASPSTEMMLLFLDTSESEDTETNDDRKDNDGQPTTSRRPQEDNEKEVAKVKELLAFQRDVNKASDDAFLSALLGGGEGGERGLQRPPSQEPLPTDIPGLFAYHCEVGVPDSVPGGGWWLRDEQHDVLLTDGGQTRAAVSTFDGATRRTVSDNKTTGTKSSTRPSHSGVTANTRQEGKIRHSDDGATVAFAQPPLQWYEMWDSDDDEESLTLMIERCLSDKCERPVTLRKTVNSFAAGSSAEVGSAIFSQDRVADHNRRGETNLWVDSSVFDSLLELPKASYSVAATGYDDDADDEVEATEELERLTMGEAQVLSSLHKHLWPSSSAVVSGVANVGTVSRQQRRRINWGRGGDIEEESEADRILGPNIDFPKNSFLL